MFPVLVKHLLTAAFTVCCVPPGVVDSIKKCGREICRDDEICCAEDNHTISLTCCRQFPDSTYYSIAMVTRKLSGVFILLLLFAVGYFVQRVMCSKSRRTTAEEHPTGTVSQEPLVQSNTTQSLIGRDPGPSAVLPTYDECQHLPTYEETMRGDGPPGSSRTILPRDQDAS